MLYVGVMTGSSAQLYSLVICYVFIAEYFILRHWFFFLSLMDTYAVTMVAIMNCLLLIFFNLLEATQITCHLGGRHVSSVTL